MSRTGPLRSKASSRPSNILRRVGDCRSIELELEKYDVGVAKDDRGGLLRNPIEVVVVGDMPLLRADSVELPVAEAPPAEYRLDGSDQLELGDESKDMTADFARVSCVHTRDELLTAKASFSLSLFLHPGSKRNQC